MNAEEIVTQLAIVLPTATDLFSNTLDVLSIANVGNVVTVVTDGNHGLVANQGVVVSSTAQLYSVDTLTQSDGIAECATTGDNDLTFGDPARPNITIIGANEPGYNDDHALLNVLNRRNFQFQVDEATPGIATGTIFLQDSFRSHFNGRFFINVISTTSFSYDLGLANPPIDNTISGTPSIKTSVRVAKAANIERTLDSYTKQLDGELWGFVVMGDQTISRDRAILSDAAQTISKADKVRIREIQPVAVYVFIPTTEEISGGDAKDLAITDVKKAIFKALFRFKPSSNLADPVWSLLTPVSNGTFAYSLAYYVHIYQFEQAVDLVIDDGVVDDQDRAFRDVDFSTNNEFGELIWSASVDLDEQPL